MTRKSTRSSSSGSASQRQLRVAEQIRHVLIESLQRGGFDDPALINSVLITINEVRISPDLKNATAYARVLGGTGTEEITPALNAAAVQFQRDIARKLQLKFTPRVRFVADTVPDAAQHIDELLQQARTKTP